MGAYPMANTLSGYLNRLLGKPAADIAVTMMVKDLTPLATDQITFTVIVRNLGSSAATGVVVSDPDTGGLFMGISTPSVGTKYDPATSLWTIETLVVGATATLILTGYSAVVGTTMNTATVIASSPPDPKTANNSASARFTAQ